VFVEALSTIAINFLQREITSSDTSSIHTASNSK